MTRAFLTTAFFPPVCYFSVMKNHPQVYIEACESYQKQSYRTRCHIYATGGQEVLQVPVCHDNGMSVPISQVRIDYTSNWIHRHSLAIISAYMSSPFFEYYWDDISAILNSRPELLMDLNTRLLTLIADNLSLGTEILQTETFSKEVAGEDFRFSIHPKTKYLTTETSRIIANQTPYYQVFSAKHGFIPNLSILDLLFHEGPQAAEYL